MDKNKLEKPKEVIGGKSKFKMREISPAVGIDVDNFISNHTTNIQKNFIIKIREQKEEGKRTRPSTLLLDKSEILTPDIRARLLDEIADLVDENLFGRSDMCIQFAELLSLALNYLKIDARLVLGIAIYYEGVKEIFRWKHAWVRTKDEIIDGNVDSVEENPLVPLIVKIAPYWGKLKELPKDRVLQENRNYPFKADEDVANIWWPDLQKKLYNLLPES